MTESHGIHLVGSGKKRPSELNSVLLNNVGFLQFVPARLHVSARAVRGGFVRGLRLKSEPVQRLHLKLCAAVVHTGVFWGTIGGSLACIGARGFINS